MNSYAMDVTPTSVGSWTYTCECGTSSKNVTVTAVKPEVVSVDFREGGVQTITDVGTDPEWTKAGRNEPFVSIKNAPINFYVKFSASKNLTFATSVMICEAKDATTQYAASATWQNWPSAEIGRGGQIPNVITTSTETYSWRYSVDAGANWEECNDTSHTWYSTWSTYKCSASDFTKKHIHYVVSKANNSTTMKQAAEKLGPDAVSGDRFSLFANHEATPWDIIDTSAKSDCVSLCTLMKRELELLGDESATLRFVYACNASWDSLASTSRTAPEICNAHGTHPLLFWAGGGYNSWEACLRHENRWWMGGGGDYQDHPIEVLRDVTSPNIASSHPGTNHQCICVHPVPYPETNTPAGRVIPQKPYPPCIPDF
jgi:hypothetical protein